MGVWARRIAKILGIVGVLVAVTVVRAVTESRTELRTAEKALESGDVEAAIVHFRRSARWYAPASPYPPRALAGLAQIARNAESEGDVHRALRAWRSIRGSILSTRSWYTPHVDRLEVANARIADLMAGLPPPPIDAGKSLAQLRAEHFALLEKTPRPHVGWTLVLLLGFFSWVGGAFAFASCAIDHEDRLVRSQATRWGLVVLCGFGLFVLGMSLA